MPVFHGLTAGYQYFLDGALYLGLDFVHNFHSLDYTDNSLFGDVRADLDVRFGIRAWRGVESSHHRRFYFNQITGLLVCGSYLGRGGGIGRGRLRSTYHRHGRDGRLRRADTFEHNLLVAVLNFDLSQVVLFHKLDDLLDFLQILLILCHDESFRDNNGSLNRRRESILTEGLIGKNLVRSGSEVRGCEKKLGNLEACKGDIVDFSRVDFTLLDKQIEPVEQLGDWKLRHIQERLVEFKPLFIVEDTYERLGAVGV